MAISTYKIFLPVVIVITIWLFRPATPPPFVEAAKDQPFQWKGETLFGRLEGEFIKARQLELAHARRLYASLEIRGRELLDKIVLESNPISDLHELESVMFRLGALAAGKPSLLATFQSFVHDSKAAARKLAKNADDSTFRLIYRVMYGGRTALDEVIVQAGIDALSPIFNFDAPKRDIPTAVVHGIQVQSGDIALSRGGAPTSALIARGSDFPGNFSHAALVHIDEVTGEVSVIESLIEKGVVITPLEDYLKDKKLRILLLRLESIGPGYELSLPHDAASLMLKSARKSHIPYDFKMDWLHRDEFFCSEVPFHAYRDRGVELWEFKSQMSSKGLVSWLASLGARHSSTLVPSALEYEWKLTPVVEWRNLDTLLDDRMDNAVLDALLDEAEQGLRLDFPFWKLPLARLIKAYSVITHMMGMEPVIPKGLYPEQALSVEKLNKELFPGVRKRLEDLASQWEEHNGFKPPYWELYNLAKTAAREFLSDY